MQCHVVNNLIIRPLHERRVDVTKGDQSLFCHSRGEGDRVCLGYPHVERAIGEPLHHIGHRTSGGHGGSYSHDTFVFLGHLHEGMPKYILIKLGLVFFIFHDSFARLFIEKPRGVPYSGRFLCRLVPFSFYRFNMKQLGSLHIFNVTQDTDQAGQVVPIHGPEVAYIKPFKKVLFLCYKRFNAVIKPQYQVFLFLGNQFPFLESLVNMVSHPVVFMRGGKLHQVVLHGPHVIVDRHVVVVQYNQEVIGVRANIVQTLVGKPPRHRSIPDNRHDAALIFIIKRGRYSHAQRG